MKKYLMRDILTSAICANLLMIIEMELNILDRNGLIYCLW